MHKRRENDEDDFASLSNEERERKLRQAAQRIQVAGANVHLSKSAFRSDTRRKASLDLTAMAEHDKDTLSVSEEASAMAADRNVSLLFSLSLSTLGFSPIVIHLTLIFQSVFYAETNQLSTTACLWISDDERTVQFMNTF